MSAIRIGSAAAAPGERAEGQLVLGHLPDGPIASPVVLVRGRRDGPTLWVQGCIHGAEVGGPVAMARFLDGLDPAAMRGSVACIMLANPAAFRAYARNTPHDGENLNRVFPGDAAGPHSRQAADILLREALARADAVLDLHSGGDRSVVPFYAIHWDDGSDAAGRAGELARATGTPDIWSATDDWLRGAMFTQATLRGVPGVIVECGGGAQVRAQDIANFVTAMRGMAAAMGILAEDPPRQATYRALDHGVVIYSAQGGLFEPAVRAGDTVVEGQVLGRIRTLTGAVAEEVRAPLGPGWIGSVRRAWMPVYSGDQVAEVMRIRAAAG